ncbi:hypothetical protein PJ311_00975 [Bacillus sp. CLL-7-23]|uniref:Uncharacterized protein n=1 Tax=Bacillus changyiensis TaxID=3004103 RepID=A0ABT4WZ18_9BACI|nr:hypothetical protein [Bacillus changyiensis]MDA7025178.1 hypothetical protein [Bacillus changyiensis]
MKSRIIKFLLVLTVALGGFASFGFIDSTPSQAKSSHTKSYWHYGHFNNYVYSKEFKYESYLKWTHPKVSYTGYARASITTYGGKGKIKAIVQYKTKKGWKNYKTIYAKKKGYTYLGFYTERFGLNTKFRYKFVNTGSKKSIRYAFHVTWRPSF